MVRKKRKILNKSFTTSSRFDCSWILRHTFPYSFLIIISKLAIATFLKNFPFKKNEFECATTFFFSKAYLIVLKWANQIFQKIFKK